MGQLLDVLGNRSDGQLIRSTDWNKLVAAVDNLETLLIKQVADLEGRMDKVEQQMTQMVDRQDKTDDQIKLLVDAAKKVDRVANTWTQDYYKVTMKTTRLNYPIGEAAVLEAQVTDVFGLPLNLVNETTRPWVDFVANWGLLKPAPGFTSRGGVGERSISVRVNRDGLARIHVRAEHGEGVSEAEEAQVATALSARVPALNKSLSRVIMESATPVEAHQAKAFSILREEYDREAETSVRRYIDTAYLRYSPQHHRKPWGRPAQGWRDHRTTVLAFVKRDNNPVTADHCRASSSIDILFRNWVGSFVELDYLPEITIPKEKILKRFKGSIDPDFIKTVDRFKDNIKVFAKDQGWLGRLRNLRAVNNALEELQVDDAPAHLKVVTQSLRDAVTLQQTLDSMQLTTADPTREVALDVFTNSQVRADQDTAGIRNEMGMVREQVAGFSEEFEEIRNVRLEVLKFDVGPELEQLRKDFDAAEKDLKDLNKSVIKLESTEVKGLKDRLNGHDTSLNDLKNGFFNINTTITRLDEKTGNFEVNAGDLIARQKNLENQVRSLEVLEINPGEVSTGINQIGSILNRIDVLERNR